jgi:hypothetical protein
VPVFLLGPGWVWDSGCSSQTRGAGRGLTRSVAAEVRGAARRAGRGLAREARAVGPGPDCFAPVVPADRPKVHYGDE